MQQIKKTCNIRFLLSKFFLYSNLKYCLSSHAKRFILAAGSLQSLFKLVNFIVEMIIRGVEEKDIL